ENIKPENIYPQFTEVIRHYADYHNIPLENDLMKIEGSQYVPSKSRIIITDQWASHPSHVERERHLLSLNIKSEIHNEPAWSVFRNPEELQKLMTEKVYAPVKFKSAPLLLDRQAFVAKYISELQVNQYDAKYRGYYDRRNISLF